MSNDSDELKRLKDENRALKEKLSSTSSYVERFNMIVDHSSEWVWEVNINGIYTFVSAQVKHVLGYEPSELIGKTPFNFMSENEAERVGFLFKKIVENEDAFSKLYNICLHKDGSEIHTETSGQPFYDDKGVLLGYRGIDFDRTKEFNEAKALQKKLTNQNRLIDSVTNSIDDLIFYKDFNFIYIGCNQAFCDFVGIPREKIIGKSDYELFDKEYADIFRDNDTKVINGMKTNSNYETVVHANGDELYLLTKKSPIRGKDGELIGLVGVARDLTKEHELELQLKKSNDFLIDAQSLASIGHWEWDIESGVITWSDEIFRIFGFEVNEFTPTYDLFLNTVHPKDRGIVSREVSTSLENKSNYDIQHRIVIADGTEKIVHEIGHAIYEGEEPIRMIGTVQDISKLKEVEDELKEQKEAFETIFEASSDGLLLIEDGKFIECNNAVVDIMKASNKEEIINLYPYQLSPKYQPDGQLSYDKAEEMINICKERGKHKFEWLHKRMNDDVFWAEVLLTNLRIKEKDMIHVSWRDISDRKQLEIDLINSNNQYKELIQELDTRVDIQSAQLTKQSKMAQMGELLSMIAHQWRQPLSAISAVTINLNMKLDLLRPETADKDSMLDMHLYIRKQMNEITRYVKSLSTTIDDFRNLYKIDKEAEKVSVIKPIDDAFGLIQISLNDSNIRVEKIYNNRSVIGIRSNEIMQAIINLLTNAKDNFLERETQEPVIKVTTTALKNGVKIDIEDNGGGIPEDIIDNIFDPYFSTKNEKNGTGLGLYMCKSIIEKQHKGKIYALNTHDGVRFSIELPKNYLNKE